MTSVFKKAFFAAALSALAVPAFSQSTTANPGAPTIPQRKGNQQDQIANGVQSG